MTSAIRITVPISFFILTIICNFLWPQETLAELVRSERQCNAPDHLQFPALAALAT
jgi:hypothetical protein